MTASLRRRHSTAASGRAFIRNYSITAEVKQHGFETYSACNDVCERSGGLKVDTEGRVIDTDGQIIPGLHA
jgi:hypothetical protein